jgi:hypothetical protein
MQIGKWGEECEDGCTSLVTHEHDRRVTALTVWRRAPRWFTSESSVDKKEGTGRVRGGAHKCVSPARLANETGSDLSEPVSTYPKYLQAIGWVRFGGVYTQLAVHWTAMPGCRCQSNAATLSPSGCTELCDMGCSPLHLTCCRRGEWRGCRRPRCLAIRLWTGTRKWAALKSTERSATRCLQHA